MNTPELKVGQRFLVKSGTDIIEYSVQEITADGKYHRISPAIGTYSQWVELWNLDILHVFEAPVEKTEWSNRDESLRKLAEISTEMTEEGRCLLLRDAAKAVYAGRHEISEPPDRDEQKPATVAGLDPAWEKDGKTMIATAEVTEDGIKVTDIRDAETVQSDENSRLCFQPPSWNEVLKRNGNENQPPPVTPMRPLLISASRVNTGNGQWFLRALIETAVNGTIIRSAVESSDTEDETAETLISKITDLINRIPENIRYMANRLAEKPAEEPAKD